MSVSESGPPAAVQEIQEILGVRPIPPPPEDFNPRGASDRDLQTQGYPVRPDIERYPELHERWEQLVSQPITFIEPEFAIMADRRGRQRGLIAQTRDTWSGSVIYTFQDPVWFVSGHWTVPAVVQPQHESGSYWSAAWVGIDGAAVGDVAGSSTDILQAGTEQDVDGSGSDTFAWFEWYDGPQCKVPNLKVRPGDVVYCAIGVITPTQANVFMWNMTTGVATRFTKTAGDDRHVVGDTVQWILETPRDSHKNPGKLAQFSWVYFDQCFAFTGSGMLFGGRGQFQKQRDVNNKVIASAVAMTDELFAVRYAAGDL